MSGLAWIRGGRLVETFSVCITGCPIFIGKGKGRHIDDAPIEHLPDPSDQKAELALALYREASAVNVIPCQFLGYYKIINILRDSGKDQKAWIANAVPRLADADAVRRRDQILQAHGEVAEYLYTSGRCAVAHVFQDPVINPDNPEDAQRLATDLPLIKALAEHAVEHEFGVKSFRTILREHLFELEGFRELFGDETVAELKAGKSVDSTRLGIPDRMPVRLKEQPRFSAFEGLADSVTAADHGVVRVRLRRDDGLLEAVVLLCFPDERLFFDLIHNAVIRDDGSLTAAEAVLDFIQFERAWMANGVNDLWDSETGRRLGQSAPVMLVNCRPDWDAIDREIDGVKVEIERRKLAAAHDRPSTSG